MSTAPALRADTPEPGWPAADPGYDPWAAAAELGIGEWRHWWPEDGWWRPWWETQDPLAVQDILDKCCCPVLDPVEALGQALLARRGHADVSRWLVWVQREPGDDLERDAGGTWSVHAEIPAAPGWESFDPAAEAVQADFLSALTAAGRCAEVHAGRSVRASGLAFQEEAQVAGAIISQLAHGSSRDAAAVIEALRVSSPHAAA